MSKLKSWKEILPGGVISGLGGSLTNKTGTWKTKKIVIDKEKCVKCRRCVMVCPEKAIMLKEDEIVIDDDYCKGCKICVGACPRGAIK